MTIQFQGVASRAVLTLMSLKHNVYVVWTALKENIIVELMLKMNSFKVSSWHDFTYNAAELCIRAVYSEQSCLSESQRPAVVVGLGTVDFLGEFNQQQLNVNQHNQQLSYVLSRNWNTLHNTETTHLLSTCNFNVLHRLREQGEYFRTYCELNSKS